MQKSLNKKYKYLLFDLDGTLLDTAHEFHYSLNQLLNEEKLPSIDFNLVRNMVSDGAGALITLGFGIDSANKNFESKKQKLLKIYEKVFLESCPFEGINDLIKELSKKNIAWGIVTNKPKFYANQIFTKLEWNRKTDILICPDDVNNLGKPDPSSLNLAIKRKGFSKDETIYIGDNWRDIKAADNAQVDSILALYGYLDKKSAANIKATFYVDQPIDIISFF